MEYRIADRMVPLTGSAIREIFKLLKNPNIISFAGGAPNPDTFATDELAYISARLLRDKGRELMQYGVTEGYAPYRETAASFLKRRGIDARPENVIGISGAQQGIDLASKAMLNKGDTILVESPTFLGALQIFATYEANIVAVEMDDDGVILSDLEAKMAEYSPKLFYTIPAFQNPTGLTLSLERRKAIVELADRYDVVVLEDDPYGEFCYVGEPLPSIKSFDTKGRVVHLLSFSKLISPGLRVGAAVAEGALLAKMAIGKQGADTHSTLLSQAIVDEYLRAGGLDAHLPKAIELYSTQLSAMTDAIAEHFPKGAKLTAPRGGLFIWGELPAGLDALEILKQAVDREVAFIPGTHFYANGGHPGTMRLNFSASSVDRIKQGIKVLGEVIASNM